MTNSEKEFLDNLSQIHLKDLSIEQTERVKDILSRHLETIQIRHRGKQLNNGIYVVVWKNKSQLIPHLYLCAAINYFQEQFIKDYTNKKWEYLALHARKENDRIKNRNRIRDDYLHWVKGVF